jgi:hypothetical protein
MNSSEMYVIASECPVAGNQTWFLFSYSLLLLRSGSPFGSRCTLFDYSFYQSIQIVLLNPLCFLLFIVIVFLIISQIIIIVLFSPTFNGSYMGCAESIRPFWISREPSAWTWCNLAASQRRHYCASMNSHFPVGLVSRQWDAGDRACVSHPHRFNYIYVAFFICDNTLFSMAKLVRSLTTEATVISVLAYSIWT